MPMVHSRSYLKENRATQRAGAGPSEKTKINRSIRNIDAAAAVDGEDDPARDDENDVQHQQEDAPWSETEHSSEDEHEKQQHRETSVLKMLYKGNLDEANRFEERARKGKVFNVKHSFYKHTRCTSVAQEESSALPAGVFNVNEDSDDDEAYIGEQKEIAKEMDELRAARHWVNQEGWDLDAEARATSTKTAKDVDLRSLRILEVNQLRPSFEKRKKWMF